MNDWVWMGLDLLMVGLLFGRPKCGVFWAIQFLQLMEIPFVIAYPEAAYRFPLDRANIVMELVAIAFSSGVPWAGALMAIHIALKMDFYAGTDCDWQLHLGLLSTSIYWLNNLIILVLLAYTLPIAEPRDKELYARTKTKSRPAQAFTSASPAAF